MDNIQDRVDNWRKKIEEKKDKNEKLSEKEAKIILNEAIDISSGLVEDIINDCKKRNDDRKENFLQDIFSNINKSFSVLKEGLNYKDKLHVLVIIEILKNLNAVGSRLLKYPFSIKDRIVVTGAKFIYKNNCLKYVILKGFYKLDGNLIPQNFPKRLYNSNCILDYTDDEMILINQLLSEARKYIYGERKQVLLPHINETINTQTAKQNIFMIN